jgi:ABC-type glycerol-3-phosphate transport system substrate-binding protein
MIKRYMKMISIMLSVFLLIGITFTGCNNTTTPAGTSSVTAKPVVLTLWTWKVAFVPGFQQAAAAYEAKTGTKVIVQAYTPDASYQTKCLAAANAGNLPDVVMYWAYTGMGFENALLNLKDRVTPAVKALYQDGTVDPLIVTDAQVAAWASNDKATNVVKALKTGDIYGLPADVGTFYTIYANKTMLATAGVPTTAPADWDAFVTEMQTVKTKTGNGIVISGGSPDLYYGWCGSALLSGLLGESKYSDFLNRNIKMSDPQCASAINAWGTLVADKLIMPGSITLNIDQGDQAFAQGKAAFDLGGTFTLSSLQAMGMDTSTVASFAVPMIAGGAYTSWNFNTFDLCQAYISKTSKNVDAAFDFAKYLTSDPEGSVAYANGAFDLPAAKLTSSQAGKLLPALHSMFNSISATQNPLTKVASVSTTAMGHAEWSQFYKDCQAVEAGSMPMATAIANFDKNAAAEKAAGR